MVPAGNRAAFLHVSEDGVVSFTRRRSERLYNIARQGVEARKEGKRLPVHRYYTANVLHVTSRPLPSTDSPAEKVSTDRRTGNYRCNAAFATTSLSTSSLLFASIVAFQQVARPSSPRYRAEDSTGVCSIFNLDASRLASNGRPRVGTRRFDFDTRFRLRRH